MWGLPPGSSDFSLRKKHALRWIEVSKLPRGINECMIVCLHGVLWWTGIPREPLHPTAEDGAPPSTHPHNLLQGHHWEFPDQLHHRLVWELQCLLQQSSPKNCMDNGANHPHLFSLSAGYIHLQVHSKGRKHYDRLFTALPPGRRFCRIRNGTANLYNSFFPQESSSWTPRCPIHPGLFPTHCTVCLHVFASHNFWRSSSPHPALTVSLYLHQWLYGMPYLLLLQPNSSHLMVLFSAIFV